MRVFGADIDRRRGMTAASAAAITMQPMPVRALARARIICRAYGLPEMQGAFRSCINCGHFG